MSASDITDLIGRLSQIKQLKRSRVWCHYCESTRSIFPRHALEHGWPKCCGYTMTIDSPEERARLNAME